MAIWPWSLTGRAPGIGLIETTASHAGDGVRSVMKAVHRTVGPLLPPRMLSRSYDGVPGRIHADDLMLRSESPEHLRHSVDNAQSAISNITESLALVDRSWADVGAFLDMPSGYGRVTRLLVKHLPPYNLTACDVDRAAVRFCVAEFGVHGVVVDRDPAQTRLPTRYDVVFIGSLLTHLAEPVTVSLLQSVVAALAPSALLILSTQGASCLDHLDWYGSHFSRAEEMYRRQMADGGTCFMPYPNQCDYGVTLHARSYIERMMAELFGQQFSPVRFAERGWDRHQDVWTYQTPAEGRGP
jgi:SAM-dependent methyltransferase